tara:strand:+ start:489 stop:851 length:363 start_codon:yes stop_codon:yes gene_type:complete
MDQIEEIKPDFFIQQTKNGYKRVYPINKDINKPFAKDNIHWKRFLIGSWGRFLQGVFFIVFVAAMVIAHNYEVAEYKEILGDEDYCEDLGYKKPKPYEDIFGDLTFSKAVIEDETEVRLS